MAIMISSESLVIDFLENHSRNAKCTTLELYSREVASRNGSPSQDSMGDVGLLDLSFRKFVSFSKFLGLLVDGFEKEIVTLLSKLNVKNGYRLVASSDKRRPSSSSLFDRELWTVGVLT